MSSKGDKLLRKARQNKAGWMPDELRALYLSFGFTIRDGAGSHKVVTHPKYPSLRATFPEHPKELAKAYISTAVKLIDTATKLEAEEKEEKEDQDEQEES
jgi:hypothetical protein